MQVYQADLLKNLAEGKEFRSDYIEELFWAIHLALRATKEMAQAHQPLCGSNGNGEAPMFDPLVYQGEG